jgi:hypothetical protein
MAIRIGTMDIPAEGLTASYQSLPFSETSGVRFAILQYSVPALAEDKVLTGPASWETSPAAPKPEAGKAAPEAIGQGGSILLPRNVAGVGDVGGRK